MNRLTWLFFLFFAILASKSFCQDKFMAGINGGIVYSSFSSKGNFDPFYSSTIRPSVNIDISYRFADNLFLQSGLGYYHTAQKRIHFTNDFIGLQIPLSIGIDLKKKNESSSIYPFVAVGGELIYILKAIHNESANRETINSLIDPLQLNGLLRVGVKKEMKNGQRLIASLQSKIGLSGFPAGRKNPSLPQLWPFQFGFLIGWEISANQLLSKK